ncbi:hypothetical protein MGYG_03799 [Nannizzia gypsea CBS 118893]|uniref:Uncharacterized protein n=1 Tax=Arthroderma gypseum (strain ATCC MYA-4604 / CBS 118893) TaxID=535722 RepID=E4UTY9_ARTGP|nr:hypothetical protein MGYG_03799 [Nannizzia gypsea CBS 118893]EFR00795.1 hypothetical protein MGYG_03799 [Nannizzia gypsea CBS 118893]
MVNGIATKEYDAFASSRCRPNFWLNRPGNLGTSLKLLVEPSFGLCFTCFDAGAVDADGSKYEPTSSRPGWRQAGYGAAWLSFALFTPYGDAQHNTLLHAYEEDYRRILD